MSEKNKIKTIEPPVKPYEAQIVKNGNSYHIKVPAHIRKYLELEQGDKLKVELTILDRQNNVKNAVNWIISEDLTEVIT